MYIRRMVLAWHSILYYLRHIILTRIKTIPFGSGGINITKGLELLL